MYRLSLKYFVVPYTIIFIGFLLVIMGSEHGDTLRWLNSHRNVVFDFVFPYVTHVGDWLFMSLVGLSLIFYGWRVSLVFFITSLTMFITSSFLKQIVFPQVPRPSVFFEDHSVLDLLDGITLHTLYSFPSGHTMAAFMMATFLSMVVVQKRWSVLYLTVAILTAISRIYLLQHFLRDVLAGSFVGILISLVMVWSFRNFMSREPDLNEKIDV